MGCGYSISCQGSCSPIPRGQAFWQSFWYFSSWNSRKKEATAHQRWRNQADSPATPAAILWPQALGSSSDFYRGQTPAWKSCTPTKSWPQQHLPPREARSSNIPRSSPQLVRGRLQLFANRWEKVTVNTWIKDTGQLGYSLELHVIPQNRFIQVYRPACYLKHSKTLEAHLAHASACNHKLYS